MASACPIALEVRYMILYPFLTISVYNLATPTCVQSRPIIAKTCPRPSDLVGNSKVSMPQQLRQGARYSILCDCAINVRDDYKVCRVPNKNTSRSSDRSRSRERESDRVCTRSQIQRFLGGIRQYRPKLDVKIELTSWSEVNLKVFANFFIGVGGMAFGVVCISLLGKAIPSTGRWTGVVGSLLRTSIADTLLPSRLGRCLDGRGNDIDVELSYIRVRLRNCAVYKTLTGCPLAGDGVLTVLFFRLRLHHCTHEDDVGFFAVPVPVVCEPLS